MTIALIDGGGVFFWFFSGLVGDRAFEGIIEEFFVWLFIAHAEFAVLGPEHDRLTVRPADHVEGRKGFTAQAHLQEVLLNARLNGFAQGRLDLKEPVGWTKVFNALGTAL